MKHQLLQDGQGTVPGPRPDRLSHCPAPDLDQLIALIASDPAVLKPSLSASLGEGRSYSPPDRAPVRSWRSAPTTSKGTHNAKAHRATFVASAAVPIDSGPDAFATIPT
jgi:hypothetical protein